MALGILLLIIINKTSQHICATNCLYTLIDKNKAKRILNRHISYISCFCRDPIYSNSINNDHKKSHFRPYKISLLVNNFRIFLHFPLVVQAVIADYISVERSWHKIVNLSNYD